MSEVIKPLELTISGGHWNPNSLDAIEKGAPLGTYSMLSERRTESDIITYYQTHYYLHPDQVVEQVTTTTITSRRYPEQSDTFGSNPYKLGHGEVIEVIDPTTKHVSNSLKIIYDIPFISRRTSEPFE